ncbi:hypothetical protein BH09BAC5_BH09BAC5_15220 [soil metagenome]
MKRIYIFLVVNFIFLLGCGEGNKNVSVSDTLIEMDSVDSVPAQVIPTSSVIPDTIFPFQLSGKDYNLIFTHETRSPAYGTELTTTVRIINIETKDTLAEETFDFNSTGRIVESSPDHYWFNLVNEFGGSGYSGKTYMIKSQPAIHIQEVCNFNELSTWKWNKDATALLFLQGIWNMSGDAMSEDFEAHYDAHQQSISLFTIQQDTVLATEIGLTKYKYDFTENDKAFSEILKKEPGIFKRITISEFNQ